MPKPVDSGLIKDPPYVSLQPMHTTHSHDCWQNAEGEDKIPGLLNRCTLYVFCADKHKCRADQHKCYADERRESGFAHGPHGVLEPTTVAATNVSSIVGRSAQHAIYSTCMQEGGGGGTDPLPVRTPPALEVRRFH